jgi:uncharacterized protein DUF3649
MNLRYRWGVASRALAAVAGGYALASVTASFIALVFPSRRDEAVMAGALAGFLVLPACFIWVFAAATAWRAWLGILIPGAGLGAAVWFLMRGAA